MWCVVELRSLLGTAAAAGWRPELTELSYGGTPQASAVGIQPLLHRERSIRAREFVNVHLQICTPLGRFPKSQLPGLLLG